MKSLKNIIKKTCKSIKTKGNKKIMIKFERITVKEDEIWKNKIPNKINSN